MGFVRELDSPRVFLFTRSEKQLGELRECCRAWQNGDDRFWAFDDVLQALSRPGALGYFAADSEDGSWHGVALVDVGPYTADLLYIYVRPGTRRQGVGLALLKRVKEDLTARPQIEALFLEVRISNKGAQALYFGCGMEVIGRRKAYYANGEDAQVFRYEFPRP